MSGEISKNLFPLDGPNETLGSRSRFEDHYWKISLQICEAKVVDTKYIKKAHEKDGFWTAVESAHDHRHQSYLEITSTMRGWPLKVAEIDSSWYVGHPSRAPPVIRRRKLPLRTRTIPLRQPPVPSALRSSNALAEYSKPYHFGETYLGQHRWSYWQGLGVTLQGERISTRRV